MTIVIKNRILKGPLTGCEYFDDNRVLIGNTNKRKDKKFKLYLTKFLNYNLSEWALFNSYRRHKF